MDYFSAIWFKFIDLCPPAFSSYGSANGKIRYKSVLEFPVLI